MNAPTRYSDAQIAAALEACAREPVHIPGAIQPAGGLVSLDGTMRQVRQVSANLEEILGIGVAEALCHSPRELLGERLLDRLQRELADRERLPAALTTRIRVKGRERHLHVVAYRSGSRLVVELEPLARPDERRLLALVNEWLVQVGEIDDEERLLQALTRMVQRLTGHERVMVYRFDEQWNGRVVAEHRLPPAESFLGHHFPASDIPAQVRRLYDINRVRSIPDAAAAPIPLVPATDPHDPAPLDLSRGSLRAVSPIHQEYLRNMGVGASLSIAMHDEGRLWGLLACHGLGPTSLSAADRDAARALVQIALPRLMLIRARAEARLLQSIHDSRDLLAGERGQLVDPGEMVKRHGQQWLDLLRAAGVALVQGDRVHGVGRRPEDRRLEAMAAWLGHHQRHDMPWATQALGDTPLAEWQQDDLCGLLAAPLPTDERRPAWLMLFRHEQREARRWAGKPEDVPMERDGRLIMTPRRSFAQWQEEVAGRSRAWGAMERRAAGDLAEDLAVLASGHQIHRLNVQLSRVNEQLQSLAFSDSLTGSWNRYRMEQAIDAALNAAERYGHPCAVLLFDVDHFKQFNDTHGHEAGDRVLVEITRALQTTLRDSDILGRWGGEEFMVLASHCDGQGALPLAERLRRCVEEVELGELGRVTISIGVAGWHPGDTRKRLVARADEAMYRAKQNGRNRVEQAAESAAQA
ncbi:diguanylate cyclase (GGDEF)-like protein [Halomonas ventosae]|uniref:diguanylate cyclase n=1 Tax=Halomonas ventosae TaxID=229007 RepID=A0A4R6ZX77_9GAMM|nr:sensor domain-containing diguanylate cyclase [Halomonas ventosae]TDR56879.1 diguanylate cyclase (GGDEF)-like protein [Halomonas ventosae]